MHLVLNPITWLKDWSKSKKKRFHSISINWPSISLFLVLYLGYFSRSDFWAAPKLLQPIIIMFNFGVICQILTKWHLFRIFLSPCSSFAVMNAWSESKNVWWILPFLRNTSFTKFLLKKHLILYVWSCKEKFALVSPY